jgi:dynein light intermediate chain 1
LVYLSEAYKESKKTSSSLADPHETKTLELSLDVPLAVVCTKADTATAAEELTDESWDYLQGHLRLFCLKIGAALIYTSSIANINCSLLLEYLKHQLFDTPFNTPPNFLDREAVFIPSGWDTKNKIQALFDSLKLVSPDRSFESVFPRPLEACPSPPVLVQAEDEQSFLEQQYALLDAAKKDRLSSRGCSRASVDSKEGVFSESQVYSPSVDENEAIANFFNKLLKTGGGQRQK